MKKKKSEALSHPLKEAKVGCWKRLKNSDLIWALLPRYYHAKCNPEPSYYRTATGISAQLSRQEMFICDRLGTTIVLEAKYFVLPSWGQD